MRQVKIAPSILAADLGNLRGAIETAQKGGADMIHLDILDGSFAPNISFGAGMVRALRRSTRLKFDTHLMISQPRRFVHDFLEAGSDRLVFQTEVIDEAVFDSLFAIVKSYGMEIGLALKPETELPKWAEARLDRLASILILTVNPGFSGQRMDVKQFPKMERIAKLVDGSGAELDVEIDGGIGVANIHEVAKRGGNAFVAGAGIYSQPDPLQAIASLRLKAVEARSGI